ncbi:MAG: DUF1073 domain-containing protein [Xanthomonadales bacterium]|nr:DUF1073 domain-containing protein [Xanthomonadales bacterium]
MTVLPPTNGHTPQPARPARQLDAAGIVAQASVLMQRSRLAGSLGQQFAGKRDMYDVLGYKTSLVFDDFLGKYGRQDIARRVVDLPAIDTWRYHPTFMDGESEDTPFMQEWKALATRLPMWRMMKQVDRLAGIGQYAVLLIGFADGQTLDQPVGTLGADRVLYLRALTEGSATVGDLETDPSSARYGLPLSYKISMGDKIGQKGVHWQRIVHVAEDPLEGELYGTPRLEVVFNRLEDLVKIVGGGAEATWQVMDRGLHADVRDGFSLSDTDAQTLSDELEEYVHGLRRFIRTSGMDLNPLGSEAVDPSGLFEIIVSLIAAAANIPQRILLGSERGNLASSQDADTWAGVIESRQQSFAEPVIVRPLLERLFIHGALTRPKSGKVTVEWRSLLDQDEGAQAERAERLSKALAVYVAKPAAQQVVPQPEFRKEVLGLPADIPPEYLAAVPELPPAVDAPQGAPAVDAQTTPDTAGSVTP